jgi:methyltransferase
VPPLPPPLAWGLGLFLTALLVQRLGELALSTWNGRWLRAHGARPGGEDGFGWLAAIQVLLPAGLVVEVLGLGARPGPAWPLWLALWLGAQGLRYAAVRALRQRWHVRVWVVPGAPLVTSGPYRHLRHPNYLAVVVELVAGPLLFGAWRTALLVSTLGLIALQARIRVEERALRSAEGLAPHGTA